MGSAPDIAEQDLLWGKGVGYVREEQEEKEKKKHYTRVLFSVPRYQWYYEGAKHSFHT
jgi:hypothetical protein